MTKKFSFKFKILLLLSALLAALCCTVLAFTLSNKNTQTASASTGTVVIIPEATYTTDTSVNARITVDLSKKIYTDSTSSELFSVISKVEFYAGSTWVQAYPNTGISCTLSAVDTLQEGYCQFYLYGGGPNLKCYFDMYVWSPLSKISVTTQPTNKTYSAYDNFSTAGMVVTATYGSRQETVTNYTVTNGSSLTAGQTSVTVSYTEHNVTKTTTVPITVNKAQPTVNPDISLNETLVAGKNLPQISTSAGDTAGTIVWNDSVLSAGTKNYGWTFTPSSSNYATATGTYKLYAESVGLESIDGVFNAGSNTVYTTTTFDQLKSYIRLIATNNDGSTFEVPAEDYELHGTLTEGNCNLTVTYQGIANQIEITGVQNANRVALASLTAEFTDSSQKEYTAFDKFNTAGVVVTANYSDGTSQRVANYSFTYADITKDYLIAGDTYINFSYTDGTDTVTCQLRGITVAKAKPTVNPNLAITKTLFERENLPAISLADGDTAGNIAWAESTLTAGTKSYEWTFIPADSANYATATGSFILTAETLALKSLTATYEPEEGFTVKTTTPLADIKNKLKVEGVFNNGTPITDIVNFELYGTLTAGTSTLTVAYGGLTATVSIPEVVLVKGSAKVTPKVSVTGALIEGNPLPAIALSDGDTAGALVWDSVDGDPATLIAGEHTYFWTFTPNDTATYDVVTGSYVFTADPVKVTNLTLTIPVIGTPIYPETSLEDLKELIVVTATYNNGEVKVVDSDEYDLYANLKVGDSKLLVEYGGATGYKIVTVQSSTDGGVRVSVHWMAAEFAYDGKEHLPTPYIEWNGEKILLEARLLDGFDGVSAGTQKVEAVEPDSGKYVLSGETVMTYSIAKAEVSVVWSTDDGWTYNGEAQNPAAQIEASVNDGNIAVSFKITAKSGSTLTDGKAVNAGSYVAEVTLTGAENYEVTGNRTFEFTIAKKQLAKPTALTTEFTYDGNPQNYVPTGFDGSLMTITGGTQTEAGEYAVTVELLDKTNYEWADGTAQPVDFSFKIGAPTVGEAKGGGISTGAIIGIIVALCVVLLVAVIALFIAIRRPKAYVDPDGFQDEITEDDLK